MGAELCGFILVGPSKLSDEAIGHARNVLAEVEAEIEEYSALGCGQKHGDLGDDLLPLRAAAETMRMDVFDFIDHYKDAVRDKLLNTFLDLWHGKGSLRDMMIRSLPRRGDAMCAEYLDVS